MLRIKQRTTGAYALTATAVDDDGVVQHVDSPSITVKDGAGTTVATGTPSANNQHVLSFSLTASLLPKLDTYSVIWSGTIGGNAWSWTDELELCGGYLFEIADLRAMDRAFENTTKYPTATLRQIRTWAEQTIEGKRAARVAFVPRSNRAKVSVTQDYSTGLILPDFAVRKIHSLSVDGVAWTQTEIDTLTIEDNIVWNDAGWIAGNANIEVHYEHGHDIPAGPVTRAALLLAREYLLKSELPSRATATSIGDQWFRINVAGRDGVTGLPEVDAVIDQFGRKFYGIG